MSSRWRARLDDRRGMVGRAPLQVQDPSAPKLHHKKVKVNDKYIGEVICSKKGTFQSRVLGVLEQSCGLSDNGMDCKCGKSPNLSNEMDPSVPGVWSEVVEAHIDATAWKVARSAATMPSLVRSENPVAWETFSTPITQKEGVRTLFQRTWSLPMGLICLIRYIAGTR